MPQSTETFTVTDPRLYDGDVFDVAQRSCDQAAAVARILATCVDGAGIMARNAQLERNLQETKDDARAREWEDSPQSRMFGRLHKQAKDMQRDLERLSQASAFNPKAPMPKG